MSPNWKFDAGFVYIKGDSAEFNRNEGSTAQYGLLNGSYDASVTIVSGQVIYSFCPPGPSAPRHHRAAGVVPAVFFLRQRRGRQVANRRSRANRSNPASARMDRFCTRASPPRPHGSRCPAHVHFPSVIRKAAVLGAGVMGAQIAAHLANADVPVVLFDLPAKEGDPNGIVRKALDGLAKLEPSPLATKDRVAYIDAANYDRDLALLAECDLVIEAIAERMDWKHDLYAKIGAAPRAARDGRVQHVGAVDQRAGRARCPPTCARASAASTSSTRRGTCTWSS